MTKVGLLSDLPTVSKVDRINFARVIANNVDSGWGSIIGTVGTGMSVNQSAGNLVLTTGTSVNQETIIRSLNSFTGPLRFYSRSMLSQRIANQSFFVELVDIVQDNATVVINSATSVTVTYATAIFDSSHVGQAMYLGNYIGSGTFVPGRYPIASVTGNAVTYTVAGFAVGSGTCSVFGRNYYQLLYDGTTPTSVKFDTQRSGYCLGFTSVTINTTASPGHLMQVASRELSAVAYDGLLASATGVRTTLRGSRDENVPDDIENLYVQFRVVNGASAPASTSTWTIGFFGIAQYEIADVVIQDAAQIINSPLAVDIARSVGLSATMTLPTGSAYSVTTAATTNAAAVKTSAGSLMELTLSNPTATPMFVKFYNKASAPTVGTDIPILTIALPATTLLTFEFGAIGKRFTTGIAIAVTANLPDTDNTVTVVGAKIHASYI